MTTLTPELEISAARMDLQCAEHRLRLVAVRMRLAVKGGQDASFGHVYSALARRADRGNRCAARLIAQFRDAAAVHEGARAALVELTAAVDHDPHDAVCLSAKS